MSDCITEETEYIAALILEQVEYIEYLSAHVNREIKWQKWQDCLTECEESNEAAVSSSQKTYEMLNYSNSLLGTAKENLLSRQNEFENKRVRVEATLWEVQNIQKSLGSLGNAILSLTKSSTDIRKI